MNSKAHIIAGIIFATIIMSVVAYTNTYIKHALLLPLIAIIYSQLPDTDHQNSKITHFMSDSLVLMTAIFIVLAYLGRIDLLYALISSGVSIAFIAAKRTPHRGIMHTLTAGTVLSLPLLFIGSMPALIGFAAYWSHLWMDIKTEKGIIMYPFRLWGKII